MEKFEGFNIFYCGECESAFIAPKSDMSISDFIKKSNDTIKNEWCLEDYYRNAGYPFKEDDVHTTHVVFDPEAEWEDQKGLYKTCAPSVSNAIECYKIQVD